MQKIMALPINSSKPNQSKSSVAGAKQDSVKRKPILNWDVNRRFGFIQTKVEGQHVRVLIHANSLTPTPPPGENLNKKTIAFKTQDITVTRRPLYNRQLKRSVDTDAYELKAASIAA